MQCEILRHVFRLRTCFGVSHLVAILIMYDDVNDYTRIPAFGILGVGRAFYSYFIADLQMYDENDTCKNGIHENVSRCGKENDLPYHWQTRILSRSSPIVFVTRVVIRTRVRRSRSRRFRLGLSPLRGGGRRRRAAISVVALATLLLRRRPLRRLLGNLVPARRRGRGSSLRRGHLWRAAALDAVRHSRLGGV